LLRLGAHHIRGAPTLAWDPALGRADTEPAPAYRFGQYCGPDRSGGSLRINHARPEYLPYMVSPLLSSISMLEPLEVVPKQVESLLF
jgi:hypothetical protein